MDGWNRRRIARVLAACGIGLASAGTSAPVAHASVVDLAVLVDGYELYGQVEPVDPDRPPTVLADLLDPEGRVRSAAVATAGPDGRFELRFLSAGVAARRPVPLRPGDRVRIAAAGMPAADVVVPHLTAATDPVADGVAGTAPAGASVSVTARGRDGKLVTRATQAGADGRWSVALGDRLDVQPGVYGSALYFDPSRTVFQTAWAVPEATVDVGGTAVSLRARPGDDLRLRLVRADGATAGAGAAVAWTGAADITPRDTAGAPVAILPGDHVIVTSGERSVDLGTVELRVPPLSAAVDPDRDRVDGAADAGAAVVVQARTGDGDPEEVRVVADAMGRWRADFAGAGLGWDTRVTVGQVDTPTVVLEAYAPRLVTVDGVGAATHGRGQAGTPVTLSVVAEDGTARGSAAGRVGADGTFALSILTTGAIPASPAVAAAWPDADGEPSIELLPLADGDTVRVTIDGRPIEVVHRRLTAIADTARDRVAGIAAPGSTVQVYLDPPGVDDIAFAAADGAWAVDFAGVADVRPGAAVRVVATGAGAVRRELALAAFRASVQTNGDRVRVEGHRGLAADVEVERDRQVVASGRCVVAQVHCDAWLADPDGRAVPVRGGDLVLVFPDDGPSTTVDIFPMTAHIDRSGSDVVGLAPPLRSVAIQFSHGQGGSTPVNTVADTDEAGVYDHEISASQADLMVPGLMADVFHTLTDGHRLWALGVLEVVRATVDDAVVRGIAEPGARVRATLARPGGGEPIAGDGVAAGDGSFRVTVRAAGTGLPVVPAAGDRLDVVAGRAGHALVLPPLAAWPFGADGAVAGATSPLVKVEAFHHLAAAPGDPRLVAVAGAADASGVFVLPAPAVDPARVRAVEVVVRLPGGGELALWLDGAARAGRAYLPVLSSSASGAG